MPRRGLFSYENALVLILGMTFGIVFFDRQAASNLAPLIMKDLNLNNTQVGLIGSALSATWALSAYLVGLLSDRTGKRKPILILCVVGFSLSSLLSGIAHSFNMLLLSRFLMGLLEGGVMPICLAIMTVESTESRRGFNNGVVQNGFSNLVGNMGGPIILAAMALAFGWRASFFLSAIPGLLCAAAIWLWVKEPTKTESAVLESGKRADDMSLLDMFKVRNVLVCSLLAIFMVGWYICSLVFYPVYLANFRHIDLQTVGVLVSMFGAVAFLGGFMLPALSDRIGRRPVMIGACFLSVVAPLSALYFTGPLPILGFLIFIGSMGAGVFPLFMGTIPGESLPRRHIATAMGLVVGVGEIFGGTIAPLTGGWLADHTSLGLKAPFVMMVGMAILGGIISLFLTETAPAKVGNRAIEENLAVTVV